MGKLDLELELLKCKIHEEDVRNEFKENLEKKLNEKYESYEPKRKTAKIFNFNAGNRFVKAAATAVACTMIMSTCAFGDEIEGLFNQLFANTNQVVEEAYEDGNMQKVDSEYQTYDGVSIKADYISYNKDDICITFNIKTDIDYKKIFINNLELKDENENFIYDGKDKSQNNDRDVDLQFKIKRLDKINSLLMLTLLKNDKDFNNCKIININVKEINLMDNKGNDNIVTGDWKFEIKLKD